MRPRYRYIAFEVVADVCQDELSGICGLLVEPEVHETRVVDPFLDSHQEFCEHPLVHPSHHALPELLEGLLLADPCLKGGDGIPVMALHVRLPDLGGCR